MDSIIMRDKLWVELRPGNPDCDIIAKHFFRSGKNGAQIFKPNTKVVINFHLRNDTYDQMLSYKEGIQGREDTHEDDEAEGGEPSVAANFTAGILLLLNVINLKFELGSCKCGE